MKHERFQSEIQAGLRNTEGLDLLEKERNLSQVH